MILPGDLSGYQKVSCFIQWYREQFGLTPSQTLCAPQSVVLSASGGTSYRWSTGALTASISVSPLQTTLYSVTVTGSNGCYKLLQTTVTVQAQPSAPTIGTQLVGTGGVNSLTLTATGCAVGSTVRWTGPNNTTATGSSWVQSLTQTSTFTAFCQPTAGCPSPLATITVEPVNPTAPIISSTNYLLPCAGQSVTLTAMGCNAPALARWNNGQTGNQLVVTPTVTTTYTASCVIGQVSSPVSNEIKLTLSNPLTISGRTVYIEPETIQLTASSSPTAGVSYSWSGPNGFSATGAILQRIGATPVYSGTYTVIASNTAGCAGTASVVVTVNPASTSSCTGVSASIVAPGSLTAGQTLSLSATVNPSSTSAIYSWTGPSGFTSTTIAPSIPTTTTAHSGTYSLTVTLANGCTATATTSVTVLPASTTSCSGVSASIVAPTSVTVGQTLSLSAVVSPNSASAVYGWTGPGLDGPNGFTSTAPAPSIPATTTAHSGTYSLTVTLANGCTATATTTVTVLPASTTSCSGVSASIVAPTSVTVGQTLSLSAVVSPTSASAVYAWSGPGSFTSTASAPTIPTTTTAHSGTYSLTVTLANGCTATATTTVTVLPASTTSCSGVSASIVAPTSLTAGQTLSLSAVVSPNSASAVYAWSGPGLDGPVGFTSTASAPTIPTATTAHSGTYSLKVTLPTGCTATASISVTVIPASTTSCSGVSASIVAPTSLTAGQTLSLSAVVTPNSPSAVYAWSGPGLEGPGGFTSTASAPTIPTATTAHSGIYSLKVTLPTGCTATASTNVTVIISPVVSATDCNIRIVAKDATGTETDLIPRSTTATTGASSLTLSVEHLDGLALTGYSYKWSRQSGMAAALPIGTSPVLSATAIGEYKVIMTSPEGSTCTAYITLRSKPYKQVAHTYNCGTAPATPVGSLNDPLLTNLAPGDTIRTGDFDVVVMTVSGSSGGWTGTGYTEIPYLKNTRVAVELKGAVVNDCYELVGGTIVSAYDPNWGGLQDVTQVVNILKDAITQLIDIYANYTGTQAERDKISSLNTKICTSSAGNNQLTAEQKAEWAVNCQTNQSESTAFTACFAASQPQSGTTTSGSGRVATRSGIADQQVCSSPNNFLKEWNNQLNNIAPPVTKDSNDILVGKRITILAKNDTLIIDELKIVFKNGYSFAYNQTSRTVSVTAPGKPAVEYGIAIEKVTGIFKGFYRVDYLQANPIPCTISEKKIGYENKKGATACEEGYLHHTDPLAYEEIYDIYPSLFLENANLLSYEGRSNGSTPWYKQDHDGYTVKVFITGLQTTNADRATIAKLANSPGFSEVNLWIDYGTNGQVRYEFFYGANLTQKKNTDSDNFFTEWLRRIPRPASSIASGDNPIVQVMKGITSLVGSLTVAERYWNCQAPDYYRLPFVAESGSSSASGDVLTPEGFAFACGLYDGAIGQIKGVPEVMSKLFSAQGVSELWGGIKALFTAEGWSALADKVQQDHNVTGCKLNHQIGKDVVDVIGLAMAVKGIAQTVSKFSMAGTVSQLGRAKDAVISFGRAAVRTSRNTYRVAGGTAEIIAESGKFIIRNIQAGALYSFGKTIRLFGQDYAILVDDAGTFFKRSDGYILRAQELAADADKSLLRIREQADEVLAVIKKITTNEELFAAYPDLKIVFDNLTQAEARNNLNALSPKTLQSVLNRLKSNPELVSVINDQPALTRLWTLHKSELGLTSDQISDAMEIWSGVAEGLSDDARILAEELATESQKKQAMLDKFGLGNDLSNSIKNALAQKNGPLFDNLAQQLGLSTNELAQYEIFSEIPLITTNGYMKADVMLIKKTPGIGIEDAVIIENKLSLRSPYTERQIEGFSAIINGQTQMRLQYSAGGLTTTDIIPVSKNKIFRFADHGQNNLGQVQILKITSVR